MSERPDLDPNAWAERRGTISVTVLTSRRF